MARLAKDQWLEARQQWEADPTISYAVQAALFWLWCVFRGSGGYMNQTDITGIPDFVIAAKLTSLAHDLFDYDKWIQPTQLDEDTHELIQSMHDVGLVEQGIGLVDGVQIVCYRLKESV